jgi:hypothetical protein
MHVVVILQQINASNFELVFWRFHVLHAQYYEKKITFRRLEMFAAGAGIANYNL